MPHHSRDNVSKLQRVRQLNKRPRHRTLSHNFQRIRLHHRTTHTRRNNPSKIQPESENPEHNAAFNGYRRNGRLRLHQRLYPCTWSHVLSSFLLRWTFSHNLIQNPAEPLSLMSIILGAITLTSLALFSGDIIASGSMTSTEAYDSNF